MLSQEQKRAVVADVSDIANRAQSAVAAEYRGLSVGDITALRREARLAGVYLRVVKNTLARRAVQGTGFECMADSLRGPLLLAFSAEDPAAAARVISGFAKQHELLRVKVVALSGQLLAPEDIKALATLPTREEALSRLMAVMKAPVEKLARTLAAPVGKLVRTMAALRDQQQK